MATQLRAQEPSPEEQERANSRWRAWAIIIAVAIAAGTFQLGSQLASGAMGIARIGSAAPDFTLRLFNGQNVTLSSLKGKPVLVSFWASG